MARNHGPFATTNPWRKIGIAICAGLTAGTALIGFLLLPLADRSEQPFWAAICTAVGLRATPYDRSAEPAVRYASQVVWDDATVRAATAGDAGNGAFVAGNCASCHGDKGVSPSGWIPSLAGMRPEALLKELEDYRSDHRYWPVMAAVAKSVSAGDMRDVAAFYATLPASVQVQHPGLLAGDRGIRSADPVRRLVYAGDPVRGIAPCASCHGLEGIKRAAPVLAGQHAGYLERQLDAFRTGLRKNDEGEQMRVIAARLTDPEVHGLAEFLASGAQ